MRDQHWDKRLRAAGTTDSHLARRRDFFPLLFPSFPSPLFLSLGILKILLEKWWQVELGKEERATENGRILSCTKSPFISIVVTD